MTPRKFTRFYDVVAPLYGVWSRVAESRAVERAFQVSAIQRGESVLEVGVGTGTLFSRLARTVGEGNCAGIDLSRGMLNRTRRHLKKLAVSGMLCGANACHLPFPGQTFDAILSCYMLDILSEANVRTVLGEFHRTIKPGGRLALVVMAKQSRLLDRIWMTIYHHAPILTGGCRPVNLAPALAATGWHIEMESRISQNGFRSELIFARPSRVEARAA